MKFYDVTILIKAAEWYFPVVLLIMLYKVILTFESVDEIQWYDHSNERYWTVLSSGFSVPSRFLTYATQIRPCFGFKP